MLGTDSRRNPVPPNCQTCGRIKWEGKCDCTYVSKSVMSVLDTNKDGRLDMDDIRFVMIRHEWLFVAGLFITVGSLSNVLGYTSIDSDLFWSFAGLGMVLEYLDDIRRRRKSE